MIQERFQSISREKFPLIMATTMGACFLLSFINPLPFNGDYKPSTVRLGVDADRLTVEGDGAQMRSVAEEPPTVRSGSFSHPLTLKADNLNIVAVPKYVAVSNWVDVVAKAEGTDAIEAKVTLSSKPSLPGLPTNATREVCFHFFADKPGVIKFTAIAEFPKEKKKGGKEIDRKITKKGEVVVLKVELKSIEFTSDHEGGRGANILKKSPNNKYSDVGAVYEEPEWEATG